MNQRILRDQKGSALLMIALFAAILVGSFIYVSSMYFDNMLTGLTRQRRRIAAQQVLQDFGTLAQKANSLYYQGGGVCTAPFTAAPTAASKFCFDLTTATATCVRNPHDTGLPVAQFCITDPAPVPLAISSIIIEPKFENQWSRRMAIWNEAYGVRHELVAAVELDALNHWSRWFGNTAYAQKDYKPAIAAALESIPPIPCPSGTGDRNCRVCSGAGYNTDCIQLQVCTNPAGCGANTSGQWYIEVVGLTPRDGN